VKWIVSYSDGTTATDEDAAASDIPRWGVICVAVRSYDHGRVIWHGADYYAFENGDWITCDLCGLLDYLTRPGTDKIVLIGRSVPLKTFREIFERAVSDPRLPPKSSTDAAERPFP